MYFISQRMRYVNKYNTIGLRKTISKPIFMYLDDLLVLPQLQGLQAEAPECENLKINSKI